MAEEGNTSTDVKEGKRRCKQCHITLPDIYAYTDHLESKEHIKGIMKNKYGEKYLEAKAKLDEKRNVGKKINCEDSDSSDEGKCYTCEVCEKICTGIVSYELHLSGKKHQKNKKAAKILKSMQKEKILSENSRGTEENSLLPVTENVYKSSEITCEICNKKCSGVTSFNQHMQSKTHKKKLAIQNLSEKVAEQKSKHETTDSTDDDSGDNTPDLFERCDVCSKSFSGPVPYQQHIESAAHIKQTRQVKKMMKFKELYTNTDDDKKIQCNECRKFFSGLEPFEKHLKSNVHQKLKKKNDLTKSLQEKYKEMSVRPNSIQLDSDDSDESTVIYCDVCHTAFSGPESAWDHFQSPKHKKILKEKLRYEKIKLLKKSKKSSSKSNSTGENLVSGENDEDGEDSGESFDIID